MTLRELYEKLKRWYDEKVTGTITIHLHEGGIRRVRLEQDVK